MTDEDDAARARALESEASKCQREGRYADAEKPLLEAIDIWSRLFGPDDVEVLNDQMNLAISYRRRGEAERAVPMLERAVKGLRDCPDADAPNLHVMALNALGVSLQASKRLPEARAALEAWGVRRVNAN